MRGRDDSGKNLIIADDYIVHGLRHRAAELATEWLGPRTEMEIRQANHAKLGDTLCNAMAEITRRRFMGDDNGL